MQDCPAGQTCLNTAGGFVCLDIAPAPPKGLFDVCEHFQACDAGLVCASPAVAAECDQDGLGCCTPYCEVGPQSCPGAGQVCQPLFDAPINSLPGYEDVGVCVKPL